jgi:hypothetical protein
VRVHDEAGRAQQQEQRRRAGAAPLGDDRAALSRIRRVRRAGRVARRQVDEPERREHRYAAGDAHGIVEAEQPAERLAECEREPVVERRIVQPGVAGDARHDPVPREVHLVRDLDGDDIEGAPGVVPDQARRDERQGDQDKYGVRRR